MTDNREVLLENINYEQWAEDTAAVHPLAELYTIAEAKAYIEQLEQQFAGYTDLRFDLKQSWVGFGGLHSDWYELTGIPTPLLKALK